MILFNRFLVKALPAVPRAVVRHFSRRYIAGDAIADAVRVTRELNRQGCMVTLDVLGENVTNLAEAQQSADEYFRALDVIAREKLDSNISIKLTQFGLKLDFEVCLADARKLVARAKELGNFVRIDMEDSTCTTDTIRLYDLLRQEFSNVGVAIQARLRRSLTDVRSLVHNAQPTNFRLCKGIYAEPRAIAYTTPELINKNFTLLLGEMLRDKAYVGIATHDEQLVWEALRLLDALQLPQSAYEFQMLLGVDEELRDIILSGGHRLRVYVPFGRHWHAYAMRRLKENPQIAGYIVKNIFGMS